MIFTRTHIFRSFKSWCVTKKHIQNTVKHRRWTFLRWIHPSRLWHKFSICILRRAKREYIPMKVWRFSLRHSSDEYCVFVWVNSEIMQKSRSAQNITSIIAVTVEKLSAVCFVVIPPDFVVQINNFFSLVLISSVVHKKSALGQFPAPNLKNKKTWKNFLYFSSPKPKKTKISNTFWKAIITYTFLKNLGQFPAPSQRIKQNSLWKNFLYFHKKLCP